MWIWIRTDAEISYHAEPSGTFYRYDAKAIGSGSEGAQAELVNEYHKYVVASFAIHEHTY
jgi:20S proteasome alpha/beta subunit